MNTNRGRTCLEKNLVMSSRMGVITISSSVSFQFTKNRYTVVNRKVQAASMMR